MKIKALLFAYCPVCRGVNVVLNDYDTLSRLGCGEVEQDCAFHSPKTKTSELACLKCAKKTAIAKLPIIYDIEGTIKLVQTIEDNLGKIKDRLVQLNREYRDPDWKASEGFLGILQRVALDIEEMEELLRAIKNYRFNTDTPQNYFKKGAYIPAD